MTRESQIKQKASDFIKEKLNLKSPYKDWTTFDVVFAFENGAIWADNNPHWNKWPENKPTENKVYEVLLRQPFSNKEYHVFDTYDTSYESWIGYETSRFAVAWKEVSKAPNFY